MNYPLISEYVEAIKAAEDNFDQLKHLRPVLDWDGLPVMTGGNFAVVFKMKDVETGKFHAVKCFTREQEGRTEAYRLIAEELKDVDSPYLTSIRYLDKELFVDTNQSTETEFPVLLMDWVEGKTLDKYLRENLDDKYALEVLAYRFSQLAQWLIPQPFAHGDLKPDNILVKDDGSLVLVDYDGMYVPAMKGQKARELGSPDFRHPQRTEDDFDEHIDDFPIVSILLSLKAISVNSQLLDEYGASDRLLFSMEDYRDPANSVIHRALLNQIENKGIIRVLSVFFITSSESIINYSSYVLLFEENEQKELYSRCEMMSSWDRDSQYCLSCCLRNGIGVNQDKIRGMNILSRLARNGDAKSQNTLGFLYRKGRHHDKAMQWFMKAAEQDFSRSQYNIGFSYFKGLGVDKNTEKAFYWFSKAAEQGVAVAQCYVGAFYLYGLGIEQNYEKAIDWLTRSAEQGFSKGNRFLGHIFRKGLGVPIDIHRAIQYYTKAGLSDDKESIIALVEIFEEKESKELFTNEQFDVFVRGAKLGLAEINKITVTRLNRELEGDQDGDVVYGSNRLRIVKTLGHYE